MASWRPHAVQSHEHACIAVGVAPRRLAAAVCCLVSTQHALALQHLHRPKPKKRPVVALFQWWAGWAVPGLGMFSAGD